MELGLHKIYFTICMLGEDWKINKFADILINRIIKEGGNYADSKGF